VDDASPITPATKENSFTINEFGDGELLISRVPNNGIASGRFYRHGHADASVSRAG
jgi:hypothetical protein